MNTRSVTALLWLASTGSVIPACFALDDGSIPIPIEEASSNDPDKLVGYKLTEAVLDDRAVCLDGSPGMYYHRASSTRKWFIYHEGGGWCVSLEDCFERSQGDSGSSKNYPSSISVNYQFFSNKPKINPMMHDWNMVYLKYCDGNSFSGSNASATYYKNVTLHWRGKHILEASVRDLLTNRDLNKATDVVLSGNSAGGLATFLHCDYWRDCIAAFSPQVKVTCVPRSGLFLDFEGPPKYHSAMTWAFEQQNASVHGTCMEDEVPRSNCMFAQHSMKYLKTPTFPIQHVYDTWQLRNDLGSRKVKKVNRWGRKLTALVYKNLLQKSRLHGAFLDSCAEHGPVWSVVIKNETQASAMKKWYEGTSGTRLWKQARAYPCSECCMVAHHNKPIVLKSSPWLRAKQSFESNLRDTELDTLGT